MRREHSRLGLSRCAVTLEALHILLHEGYEWDDE